MVLYCSDNQLLINAWKMDWKRVFFCCLSA